MRAMPHPGRPPRARPPAEVAHGLAIVGHGATVTLGENSGHVFFGFGTKPNGETFAEKAIEVGGIRDDSATGGQYETRMFGENGFEGFTLHAAITAGAVEVENDGEIHAAGLHVPRDISVLGFDDIEISNFLQPPLTTIRVPRAQIGVCAFNALYAANHRRGNDGTEYRISTELVIRESTGLVKS